MIRFIVFLVCLAGVVNAGALDTLRQMRVEALWLANIDTTGTARISTGMVDRRIKTNEQQVANDFLWNDPPAYVKDTFIVTDDTDAENRVFQYDLPSDFAVGGLIDIISRQKGVPVNVPLLSQPPDLQSISDEKSKPSRAWSVGQELWVHPMPKDADTLFVSYRALPPTLDSATAVTSLNEKYRDYVVWLTVADIKFRLGKITTAMAWREMYRVAKQRRTATSMQATEVIE